MHAGNKRAINAQVVILLLLSCWTSISSANILTDIPKNNPLSIDWNPAPSPEDGPPLSASASRDPSLLPAQIGAIVGAYVFCVCVVGVALILIGRRLRHIVQRSAKALDIEMLEPRKPDYGIDPSPSTPGISKSARNFSWPSPEKTDQNPYVFPTNVKAPKSPPGGGDPYVDHRIVEADREMLARDLEDLYAHVMEQEDAKAAGVNLKEMPPPAPLQTAGPVPHAAPQRQNSPTKKSEKSRPANLNIEEQKSPKSHSRSSSIISSLKSPSKRKGIRGMRISSPIPTPLSSTFPPSQASDEEPLSPRYYSPPPPPPVPTDQVPYTHSRHTSSGPASSPTRSIAEQLSYESMQSNNRSLTHFHRPNQSQNSVQSSRGEPTSATSATSQTPLYPPSPQQISIDTQLHPPPSRHPNPTASNPPSNNSSVRALPLRQFEPALTSPSFSHSTKTTVLERTSPLSPGLNTAGQPRTPWSAGAVPYSPYQPFTPLIPVTPRLVTKEERKMKKKKEGRTPVLEMIKSEDELWDSAY